MEVQNYFHYSGEIVAASKLKNILGIEYENGWIVSGDLFKPWYLEHTMPTATDPLPSEMTTFVNDYVTPMTIAPTISMKLQEQLSMACSLHNMSQLCLININITILKNELSTIYDIHDRENIVKVIDTYEMIRSKISRPSHEIMIELSKNLQALPLESDLGKNFIHYCVMIEKDNFIKNTIIFVFFHSFLCFQYSINTYFSEHAKLELDPSLFITRCEEGDMLNITDRANCMNIESYPCVLGGTTRKVKTRSSRSIQSEGKRTRAKAL